MGKKYLGFSLIELLIVISLISIISMIGLVLYTGGLKNARDSKRKADIDSITKALETNYNNSIPAAPYPPLSPSMFSGGVPKDPTTKADYFGIPKEPVKDFTICAKLEGASGNAKSEIGADLGSLQTGAYFCLRNRQ